MTGFSSSNEDAVAQATEWDPLISGGSTFRTRHIKKMNGGLYRVIPTVGSYFFVLLFGVLGAGASILSYFVSGESLVAAAIAAVIGLAFLFVSVLMGRLMLTPFTFDLDMGSYYRGKSYDPFEKQDESRFGSLKQIHALQIVYEDISTNDSKGSSYELNLVLKSTTRVNVMDHGSLKKLREDAQRLSEILNVPVWDGA